jgi:hypothetical protein
LSLRVSDSGWEKEDDDALKHKSKVYMDYRLWLKQVAPRALGALPAGGMAIGLIWTAFLGESNGPGVRGALILGAVLVLTIGGAFLRVVIRRRSDGRDHEADRLMFDQMQRASFAVVVAFGVLVAFVRVSPAQFIGPVAIFCLFGIGLSVILTWLTDHTHRSHIPWVSGLVGLALLWSILDWNDNHRLDMDLQGTPVAAPGVSFDRWLEQRREGHGGEFKVYVVAAQGGGLYAAYHTAYFLARAQDMNPDFANHLFAISGVSGGSVGAAVFHAILNSENNEKKCPREKGTCHVERVREVLRQDFLSPVAASLLFPDFTARFLPFPVSGLSRARAMEAGFAVALEAAGADPDAPLLGSWEPEGAKGPLLLFNTTDVNTGDRMVMTPLESIHGDLAGAGQGNGLEPVETMAELLGCAAGEPCQSPRLLSAALVSARFPIVTPAARMSVGNTERRYVDGGYFENSGVETAEDLLSEIDPPEGVTFHLIVLDFPGIEGAKRDRPRWLGEIMSPVRAFLNARGARGELAKRRADRPSSTTEYRSATLDDQAAQFTLGWMLSTRTFDQIEFEIDNDDVDCAIGEKRLSQEQRENRALLAEIAGLPKPADGPPRCPEQP